MTALTGQTLESLLATGGPVALPPLVEPVPSELEFEAPSPAKALADDVLERVQQEAGVPVPELVNPTPLKFWVFQVSRHFLKFPPYLGFPPC